MKGLFILADGFEDTEALTTRDVLLRAGFDIVTCSIKDETSVTTSFGIDLFSDISCNNVNPTDYDFIVLPGGGGGVRKLYSSNFVKDTLVYFENKYMFAICAAPAVLGKYGYLNNKNFTCFPGFEEGINGHYNDKDGVVVDGNIITARSMFYSIEFGLAITKLLLGEAKAEEVERNLKGLN